MDPAILRKEAFKILKCCSNVEEMTVRTMRTLLADALQVSDAQCYFSLFKIDI